MLSVNHASVWHRKSETKTQMLASCFKMTFPAPQIVQTSSSDQIAKQTCHCSAFLHQNVSQHLSHLSCFVFSKHFCISTPVSSSSAPICPTSASRLLQTTRLGKTFYLLRQSYCTHPVLSLFLLFWCRSNQQSITYCISTLARSATHYKTPKTHMHMLFYSKLRCLFMAPIKHS